VAQLLGLLPARARHHAAVLHDQQHLDAGFQQGAKNATGVSKESLQFNRDLKMVLKIQQGFQKGP
jgi:hypothetical protein